MNGLSAPLDFRATTQYQRWTFSRAALAFRRKVAWEETDKRIAAVIEEAEDAAAATAGSSTSSTSAAAQGGPPAAKRMKKDEEAADGAQQTEEKKEQLVIPPTSANAQAHLRLVHLASRKVLQVCRDTKFDRAVMATAAAYLRRFFINCTALEHDPDSVVTSSIFLAIKVEACPYTEVPDFLQRLGAARGLSDAALVSGEIPLLVGLQYHLAVHHPYRALRALLGSVCNLYADEAEARAAASFAAAGGAAGGGGGAFTPAASDSAAFSSSSSASATGTRFPVPGEEDFLKIWDAVQAKSFALVDVALTTDAVLIFTPAQVAAACAILAGKKSLLLASSSHAHHAAASGSAHSHHPAISGGWWDDASLHIASDPRLGPFLEPCVRAMIAADAPAKAVTATGPAAAGAAGGPSSSSSSSGAAASSAPSFSRNERLKQQLIRSAAFNGNVNSVNTLFLSNPNADKLLAAVDECVAMIQEALAGRYAAFDVANKSRDEKQAAEGSSNEQADNDEEDEEDDEDEGTPCYAFFQSGTCPWKEELAALEKTFARRRSPAFIPGTKAFKQRLAEAAKEREAYKAEKAAARAAAAAVVAGTTSTDGASAGSRMDVVGT